MTCWFRVLVTSTTGASPLTVIVSARPPTLSSALTVAMNDPVSSIPSRLTTLNPDNVNVTTYVPGRRFSIANWPAALVTMVRVFSMSAGLEASTDTPGSTAPDASLTTPTMDAWANDVTGMPRSATRTTTAFTALNM